MIAPLNRWLPLAFVVLVAFWLRVDGLARRPMHADEANQAVKVGELLQSGRYAFDARDHHGPTLYYAALPIAWLRGQHTLAELDEVTVRLVPALAGTLGVWLLGMLAAPLGRWTAVAAAAFMAMSPPAIYYSRYFVQETLLVTFLLGALVCAQSWWRTGGAKWAISAGVCVGLMLATKESALLFVFAAMAALISLRVKPADGPPLWRDGVLTAGAAMLVAAALYSSFGLHLAGLRDAVAAVGYGASRATGNSGHEKPWWYYLQLFTWQRNGGLVWEQLAFSSFALIGVAAIFRSEQKLLRWAAVYWVVVLGGLSITPYKTPWHAVQLVPLMALLAAGALAAIPRWPIAAGLALVVLATQAFETKRVVFRYPTDARNPYAYVHSSPDVLKYRALAEAALANAPDQPLRVISEEYWPLPWYLRGLPRVGYWSEAPETCDGALVIASATQAVAVRERLHGKYRESYVGLRPGVICVVFTPIP